MTTRLRLSRRAGRLEPVVSELSGKHVVVVGLGASGVAAARLCLRRGARVVANDSRPRDALSAEARALEAEGAVLVAGGHAAARMDG